MKRILLYIPILFISCVLSSCVGNQTPDWDEQYKDGTYLVVKFNPLAAQYRPNVMLAPNANGEYRMRTLKGGGTCREFIIGKDPFIRVDTVQNWYMVDWKWNVLLSYSHVVLPMLWTDVTKPDASYVRADIESVATGIIEKYGYVKRSEIDDLLNLTPAPAAQAGSWGYTTDGISTDHLAPVYLNRYYSVQDIPEVIDQKGDWQYTKQDFLQERLRQDSLQSIYRQRLSMLLDAGMVNSVIHVVEN